MIRTRTGEELKQLRKQAGLSQAKAAKLARTSQRSWEQWEQRPDTVTYCRPPAMVFTVLEMYIFMKDKGLEYEPME